MEDDHGGSDEYAGTALGTIRSVDDTLREAPEESLRRAADTAAAAGKPLLIKVGMHLYDPSKRNYIGWRGQSWKATVRDAGAARELRDALGVFFEALGGLGPARVIAVLREAVRAAA